MQQTRAGAQRGVCGARTHTHSLTWCRRWGQTLGTSTGRRRGPCGHGCHLQARVGLGKAHCSHPWSGTRHRGWSHCCSCAPKVAHPTLSACPCSPHHSACLCSPHHRTELSGDRQAGGPSCPELLISSGQTPRQPLSPLLVPLPDSADMLANLVMGKNVMLEGVPPGHALSNLPHTEQRVNLGKTPWRH